jgi:hypothetical protein
MEPENQPVLAPEIAADEQLPPIPEHVIRKFNEIRRLRALIGIPGSVSLRVHEARGKRAEWDVLIDKTVVKTAGKRE